MPELRRKLVAVGVTAAMILLLGTACTTPLPPPNFSPQGPCLRIVTYNVNWGCPEPEKVVQYLLQSDADLVFLQKTQSRWEATLKSRLSTLYPHSVFHDGRGAGGIAFLSKYPLQNVRVIAPVAGWFPALMADVDTPIGRLQAMNVHLRPKLSDRGSVTPSALYYTPGIHRDELEGFLKTADSRLPLVVAGDFNEGEEGPGLRNALAGGLTDALSLYDRSSVTWTWDVALSVGVSDRFDHVLFSRHLLCTGARVTEVKASDHMPVFAVLVPNTPQLQEP